jgi:two-component system OmpR family response regulator
MSSNLARILYVDDEPHIRALAKVALEKVGKLTACLCASGQEAVSNAPGFAPDMILLDVMMPGMDGPATFDALRSIEGLAHVPVVFVTAKPQAAELQRLLALGAADVIAKPYRPLELSGHLATIWSRVSPTEN